jgi:branched-chain amino acid aminotransferase
MNETAQIIPEVVWIDGRLVAPDQARVSVFDSGFMQGVGLFETMRAYRGVVFRLDQHLQRLRTSAQKLGWSILPDIGETRAAVGQVAAALRGADARVRLTVTTGSLRAGAERSEAPRLTMVATGAPGSGYPEELYLKGVTVALPGHRQSRHDPTIGHKTTSYFARLAALREAHAQGAAEAVWFNDENFLAEGSISSIFLVNDERLQTPPLEVPVLPGITRAVVMELASAMGVPCSGELLTIDDLLEADEVFLTNSMMEVMPVVRVGRGPIADEKPGEITLRLAQAYRDLVQRECDAQSRDGDDDR